ncbi:MAG: hypothetical protein ACQXXL_07085 [Candidatus Methanosuratincola sp.]|nr:hypothetical protein [Candidatus Methanosuratincola sp.]
MSSVGKQVLRIGPINAALSVLVYPDVVAPIAFDAYVCEGCGKFELFSDNGAKDARGSMRATSWQSAAPAAGIT